MSRIDEIIDKENESSYNSTMDDFTIDLRNVKKVGKNITCNATIVFTDKSDIQAYLDNELDNVNNDILDWAQSQGIVKSDDYSSGFDGKPSISGNKVTGKFTFFSAQLEGNEMDESTIMDFASFVNEAYDKDDDTPLKFIKEEISI